MWNSSSTSPELLNVLYWALLQSLANVGKRFFFTFVSSGQFPEEQKMKNRYCSMPGQARPHCIQRGSTKKKETGSSE